MAHYTLSDEEWADALGVAFKASNHARFVLNKPDEADQIGLAAGTARAQEIARQRLLGSP